MERKEGAILALESTYANSVNSGFVTGRNKSCSFFPRG